MGKKQCEHSYTKKTKDDFFKHTNKMFKSVVQKRKRSDWCPYLIGEVNWMSENFLTIYN